MFVKWKVRFFLKWRIKIEIKNVVYGVNVIKILFGIKKNFFEINLDGIEGFI